jgi:hypothetical protein
MPELVSAVIKPKGRVVQQFMEYFAPKLFPDYKEIFPEIVGILERDAKRVKSGQELLTKEKVFELMWEEYTAKFPELRTMLGISPDCGRESQPYRVVFSSLDGNVDDMTFRLYGDLNPIETLRDNNVNLAIASSDLLLAKFVSLLPLDLDVVDPAVILANLPPDTTSIEYMFPLKINQARHMLVMNYRPDAISVDGKGLPVLEDETEIAVNGEYYLIYKYLFNGRYKLREGEKVEPFVLRKGGRRKYGLEIVSSGDTLLEEARRNGSDLGVFVEPIYESSAIMLVNDRRIEGIDAYRKVVGTIKEINQQLAVPLKTTKEYMKQNLANQLIR